MNWLLMITLIVIGLLALIGMKRGLIKAVMSMLTLVISLVLVSILTPYVGGFLTNHTPVYTEIKKVCVNSIETVAQSKSEKLGDQMNAIEELPIPKSLREGLVENNNSEVYKILNVNNFYDYIGSYLAKSIVHIISYIVTFLIIFIGLKVVSGTLNILTELPVLKTVNRLGGFLLGLAQGVLLLWIFMLCITLFMNTEFGRSASQMIDQSQFLTFMYKNNFLLNLILGFTLGV
ncbi:MAG TPA: CvpA family protein [Candidatus Merdenecus merdavium]|nr:CvpA family protein [Candidatus Merdenecus merdavium]